MIRVVVAELKKAFRNKWFVATLVCMCAMAVWTAVSAMVVAGEYESIGLEYRDQKYFRLTVLSCFKHWIGVDAGQPSTGLFYILLPLMAALPYSWSLAEEKRTGYINNVLSRTNRRVYYVAKYIATFLSGGLVILVPLVVNFTICLCFFPAYTPDIFDVVYFGIYDNCLWSEAFYTAPFLYVTLLSFVTFVFAGLWAVTTSAISLLLKSRLLFTIAPFLVLLLIEYLNVAVLCEVMPTTLTPFEYLRGSGTPFAANGWVMLIEYGVLIGFSVVSYMVASKRDIL